MPNFNPRTLQESATGQQREEPKHQAISIHAPYKRVRPGAEMAIPLDTIFQSTHPTRECDENLQQQYKIQSNFNPRTLQESATQNLVAGLHFV